MHFSARPNTRICSITVWAALSEGEQIPTDSLLNIDDGQVQWKVDKHIQRPIPKYITVQIYKPKDGTVSHLNTISSRFDKIALPCVNGHLADSDIAGIAVIKIVRHIVHGCEYIHAEPEGETRPRAMAAAFWTVLTLDSEKPPAPCTQSSYTIASRLPQYGLSTSMKAGDFGQKSDI